MGTIVKYRTSELYDTVVDEHNVFSSSYDFMMFLAILGYSKNNPVRDEADDSSNEGSYTGIGLENIYSDELYRVLMMSLAYQDTGDPEALVDSGKQKDVLRQYAAGGLEIAEREFGGTAGDPVDAIMNYIKNEREESEDFEGVLGDIVNSFDDQVLNTEED